MLISSLTFGRAKPCRRKADDVPLVSIAVPSRVYFQPPTFRARLLFYWQPRRGRRRRSYAPISLGQPHVSLATMTCSPHTYMIIAPGEIQMARAPDEALPARRRAKFSAAAMPFQHSPSHAAADDDADASWGRSQQRSRGDGRLGRWPPTRIDSPRLDTCRMPFSDRRLPRWLHSQSRFPHDVRASLKAIGLLLLRLR